MQYSQYLFIWALKHVAVISQVVCHIYFQVWQTFNIIMLLTTNGVGDSVTVSNETREIVQQISYQV